jgi:hypothetical protein
MFLTKKSIARRTFLNGVGVSIALPFLESMLPAQTPLKNSAAKPPTRYGFTYVPHGMIMAELTPPTEGRNFEITPTLTPLEPFRNINCTSSAGWKRGRQVTEAAATICARPLHI